MTTGGGVPSGGGAPSGSGVRSGGGVPAVGGVPAGGSARHGGALGLLCAVQFMVVLDSTVTTVALDAIRLDLVLTESTLQYVVSLYAVTFGGLLVLGGRTGDRLGRRRVFVAGTGLLGVASLACGLAGSAAPLLGARAVQGVGAALVSATGFALLLGLFPDGPARNRALGVWSALGASGAAVGLVLGGVLTELAGWQLVFLVNVPVCALALPLAGRLLPDDRPGVRRDRDPETAGSSAGPATNRRGRSAEPATNHRGRSVGLDLPGAVAVTVGPGLLIHGVTLGQRSGFGAPGTLGTLAGAVALLSAFPLVERRAAAPLVPPRFLRVGPVAAANVAILCLMAVVGSQGFFLVLYLQRVLGHDPVRTGLAMAPAALAAFVGSALVARLAGRWPPRVLAAAGLALVAAGQVSLSRIPVDGSYLRDLFAGLLLFGLGLGSAFVAATVLATTGVPAADRGLVAGLVNTSQQVGLAVGVAVLVAVAVAVTAGEPEPAGAPALVAGYRRGLLLGAFVALAGAVAVLARTGQRSAPPGGGGPRRPTMPAENGSR
ncbi:MFS transporter [Plantactinospora sp. BB1]|uniref:MFS transporter n=1 Tax=Plantactinospora sp. BB1 TaxID=2071627 RepID=UPI000D172979|nr:MFS transporter [Plantactinospora sp. BB1]AVT37497.1 MFS transporter [Plantactinospora sp. BB1]